MMNTACNDRVAFSSAFVVVANHGETQADFDFEAEAVSFAANVVAEGSARVASVYRATESGVAAHVVTYDLAN